MFSNHSSADGALFEVLAAFHATDIVLAGKINSIPIIFAADDTLGGMQVLGNLDYLLVSFGALIGESGSNLESGFVLQFEGFALFVLLGESLPGSSNSGKWGVMRKR